MWSSIINVKSIVKSDVFYHPPVASHSGHFSHVTSVIALDGLLFYCGVIHTAVLDLMKISLKTVSVEGEMEPTGCV